MPLTNLKFTVDTHIFRELGELLVGRDSTALLELIKNCYVTRTQPKSPSQLWTLVKPGRGKIIIQDNGCGMDGPRFTTRVSENCISIQKRKEIAAPNIFKRRFTGSEGDRTVSGARNWPSTWKSFPVQGEPGRRSRKSIHATIDWERIEEQPTLDALTDGIGLEENELAKATSMWHEHHSGAGFDDPGLIKNARGLSPNVVPSTSRRCCAHPLPSRVMSHALLFAIPTLRDAKNTDPGCEITLEGEFSEGDSYWDPLIDLTNWVLEIDCKTDQETVRYGVAPSKATSKQYPDARRREFEHPHPNRQEGPFFQARILIRDKQIHDKGVLDWSRQTRVAFVCTWKGFEYCLTVRLGTIRLNVNSHYSSGGVGRQTR